MSFGFAPATNSSDQMDGSGITARDPRILAILTNPDHYFKVASRTAWEQANRDVRAEVERCARARRNGRRSRLSPSRTDVAPGS